MTFTDRGMRDLTASPETLMHQAGMTAGAYLRDAIRSINAAFDDDTYADRHPELVAAFMDACTKDFHSAMMKAAAQDLRDALRDIAGELRDASVRVG